MSNLITGYYCPNCFSGHVVANELRTGVFLQYPTQWPYLVRHSASRPSKPTGSWFYNTGEAAYNSGAREFGERGWAAFESGGGLVLFVQFAAPVAAMENFGMGATPTSTGKMPLPHRPEFRHWHGVSGFAGSEAVCGECGRHWYSGSGG